MLLDFDWFCMSDLWALYLCLKVFSVLPMYVLVIALLFACVVTVALYTTAFCKHLPCTGHSWGFLQLQGLDACLMPCGVFEFFSDYV